VRTLTNLVRLSAFLLVLPGGNPSGESRAAQRTDSRLLDIYGDKAEQPWKLQQEKGDAGTGVVISEKSGKLYLDINPCEAKVKTFSEPYEKVATGQNVHCKGHELPLFYIRQK
jgi:hypothetical protein